MSDVEDLLRLLTEAEVKFVVVGAYASIAHGSQQRTDHLDISYDRSPDNYKKLMKVLGPLRARPIGIPENLKVPFDEGSLGQGTNFTLSDRQGKAGPARRTLGSGRLSRAGSRITLIELAGTTCRVASLEHVIRSKEAADRPKDRLVLPELRAILDAQKRRAH